MSFEHPLRPVEAPSVAEEVANRLREAIQTGALRPGEHLVERALSAQMGVSNIALREAFGTLVREGLIVRVPRRGAFVSEVSEAVVEDLTAVRTFVEQRAVEHAMSNWDAAADAQVQRIVDEMAESADRRDGEALFRADERFHEFFWRLSRSPVIEDVASNLRHRIASSIRHAMLNPDGERGFDWIVERHRLWLDAVRSGDVERARAEVARHIAGTAETVRAQIAARAPGGS
jgi:DNA-binding GntR family transcriptional regulator